MTEKRMTYNEYHYKQQYEILLNAIKYHHSQHGNDKCFENDNVLYAVAGLHPHHPCELSNMTEKEHEQNCANYRKGLPFYVEFPE